MTTTREAILDLGHAALAVVHSGDLDAVLRARATLQALAIEAGAEDNRFGNGVRYVRDLVSREIKRKFQRRPGPAETAASAPAETA